VKERGNREGASNREGTKQQRKGGKQEKERGSKGREKWVQVAVVYRNDSI